MIETEIIRLAAAALAAVVLGYVLYVAAYVKHKAEKQEELYSWQIRTKNGPEDEPFVPDEVRLKKEKTDSWYIGYRLAAVVAVVAAAAIGWAAAYYLSGQYELTTVEDCAAAVVAAIIGGLIADRYLIHPIADGLFWEKVEVPVIERFLHPDQAADQKDVEVEVEVAPAEEDPILSLSFDDRVKLIEKLKKSL